jgi:hypothetical protein
MVNWLLSTSDQTARVGTIADGVTGPVLRDCFGGLLGVGRNSGRAV